MNNILTIAQAICGILTVIFILLQQRGTALGSAFGGGMGGGEGYANQRGAQKFFFYASIVTASAFIIISLILLSISI